MKISNNRHKSGFTLVELLVVIAIIAVLSVITFGVARKMMAKAKATESISNMRQVALLVAAYTAEENGKLPALREYHGDEPGQPVNWHWNQEMASQAIPEASKNTIAEDKEWWWRERPPTFNPQNTRDGFETYYSGYALNFYISANHYELNNGRDWEAILRHRTPLAAIPDPARTPLIVPHWNWHTDDLLRGQKLNDISRSKKFLMDGKLNVVFVDGHSELISFADSKGNPLSVTEYSRRGLDKQPKF